ncbi:ExbD/TolR family protein [Thaumasiovibrio sp. DFM-14]|uniref:ExbD/TolR family protein n=1 Tax=Thaumasiovibrio sp. DFM-14 TaxID=3384792 RepID=UPI0039A09926
MYYHRKRRKISSEINVVPYIDVSFALLVIFMVTAPFVTQGVDVDLPQTVDAKSAAELAQDENNSTFIVVEVDADGNHRLSVDNGDFISLDLNEMLTRVSAELQINPSSTVLVGGAAQAPYFFIIETLDALNQAGVSKVGLMTEARE